MATNSTPPTSTVTATPKAAATSDPRDEVIARVRVAILSLALLFTLAGNTVVLKLVLQSRPKTVHLSRIYSFLLHLSAADILVGICNILPQLVWDIYFRFPLGDLACKAVKFLQVFVLYLSTYVLAGMAIDRYLVIRSGVNRPPFVVRIILAASWLVAAVFAMPQLFIFSLQQLPNGVQDCWATFKPPVTGLRYVMFFVTAVLVIPVAVMAFCYTYLCWAISKRSLSDAKLRTIRMTMVMVLVFVLCWTPFCCAQLYLQYTGHMPSTFITICLLVPNLNSCANPWVCLTFSTSLRRRFREYAVVRIVYELLMVRRTRNVITVSSLQYRRPTQAKRQLRAYR
ncbi:oxytocin receptor-like, partial [Tropilaelaps mercedesae]